MTGDVHNDDAGVTEKLFCFFHFFVYTLFHWIMFVKDHRPPTWVVFVVGFVCVVGFFQYKKIIDIPKLDLTYVLFAVIYIVIYMDLLFYVLCCWVHPQPPTLCLFFFINPLYV